MEDLFGMSDTEGDGERRHFLSVPIQRVDFNLPRAVIVQRTDPEVRKSRSYSFAGLRCHQRGKAGCQMWLCASF